MRRIAPTTRTLRRPDSPPPARTPAAIARLRRLGRVGGCTRSRRLGAGGSRARCRRGAHRARAWSSGRTCGRALDGGMRAGGSRRVRRHPKTAQGTRRKCPLAVSDDDDRLDASRGAPSRTAHSTRVPARADRPPRDGIDARSSRDLPGPPVASRVVARERPAARLVPRTRRRPLANALRAAGATVAVSECTSGGILAASLLSLPGASAFHRRRSPAYSPLAREGRSSPAATRPSPNSSATGSDDNYASTDRYYESRVAWAAHAARDLQLMCGADWGVAEVGAAGPTFHPTADARLRVHRRRRRGSAPKRRRRRLGTHTHTHTLRLCETGHARERTETCGSLLRRRRSCAHDASGMTRSPRIPSPGAGDAHWKRALDGVTRTVR